MLDVAAFRGEVTIKVAPRPGGGRYRYQTMQSGSYQVTPVRRAFAWPPAPTDLTARHVAGKEMGQAAGGRANIATPWIQGRVAGP